jgi:hypothetical protein
MEALSNYFLTLDEFKNRIFVSNPPNAALLIWTNRDFLPNISGVAIVEQENQIQQIGISSGDLTDILTKQLYGTVPVLHIVYKADMTSMHINGTFYNLVDAASRIADSFHITLGVAPAKAPNNANQISDPFHIWSRDAFDGRTVMKTDIDFLLIRAGKISSVWEVKRSKIVRVGSWAPYINPNSNNDINNYLMLMSLSNLLKCKMLTVHHEEMDSQITFNGTERADFFVYNPQPSQDNLNIFALRKSSTTATINEALNL